MDWLQVPTRHLVAADLVTDPAGGDGSSPMLGRLDGLVLLDLPDFDSRVEAHRTEAQRVLELVDVFVWVTDPQKYADALLHDDYVAALSGHDSVTIVVLNQSDQLEPDAVEICRADLTRLLTADGLGEAKVMVTSARTGAGVAELRQRLANAVAGADAARARLSADVVAVATRLRSGVADSEPEVRGSADDALIDALSRSAGVPVVLEAVAEDYRREGTSHGGWLFSRWVYGLRTDPLARLRLDKSVVRIKGIDEADVRAVVGRSSIPPPSPAARAAVSLAIRRLADRACEGLPPRWATAVVDAADPGTAGLSDALDIAVMHTPLRARQPRWWRVMDVVQWIFGLVTMAGFLWLTALFVVGWLQLPDLPTPTVGQLPVPFLLLAGGIACGLVAAAINRLFVRVGSRRRAALVSRRLQEAIAEVADSRIVAPVLAVLGRHRDVREALDRARRAR